MRRLILEEPFSAAAIWGRALAAFALALAAIAILLARSGAVEATGALSVLGAAIICACLALLLAGAGAIVVWQSGRRGLGAIVAGVFAATLVLVYPAWLAAQALRLPLLNDVSTDLNDPPDFSRAGKAAAARGGADHPSISPEVRDLQRRAYKDVQPILLDLDIDEAWPLVQKAVAARRWWSTTPSHGRRRTARSPLSARSRDGSRRGRACGPRSARIPRRSPHRHRAAFHRDRGRGRGRRRGGPRRRVRSARAARNRQSARRSRPSARAPPANGRGACA